ncbi:MAG: TerB N-terminal domain-containing protein, partial [Anaerovoracaceae bacterium]
FSAYFPTYDDMSHDTLRGYFSWRTQVRQGIFNSTPLSFVFVHIYELLEKIGADTPEDGFRQLMELREHYTGEKQSGGEKLRRLLDRWLCDYVIYYGLGEEYASQVFGRLRARDLDAEVIQDPGEHAPEEVMRAVKRFSSYKLERSAFIRERPDIAAPVIRKVWEGCLDIFRASSGTYITESIAGTPGRKYYQIFSNAVFYDYKRYRHLEYKVDDTRTVICTDGHWSVDCTGDSRGTVTASPVLGQIMRETDRKMREAFGFPHPLMERPVGSDIEKVIDRAIAEYREEREKALRPVITIDVSKLDAIRDDADYTAGRLLEVSDDEAEEPQGGHEASGYENEEPQDVQEPDISGVTAAGSMSCEDEGYDEDDEGEWLPDAAEILDDTELEFLKRLIGDQPYEDLLSGANIFPSVMAESVNEKLFDVFSDNVIEEDENGRLRVVEDYAEDLEDMI